ncbi:MAG: hypothetical protein A2513_09595 [Sulfurimonas sp. RIFOXYD12_FULL_33_39]|uniref:hypothetical protein n=1 Tax=unclassified Sulfurimonas TaxID=2623549 RepID=UPI0008AFB208|nr:MULTISPECIES: hypothetical protein [unclassified Sulfurimonas]OHE10699.1 MAG: hypothetical protein A2513_09595 [Sulfurimonas sp. RIFOXYD12_FULL_33_39]OHE13212.1 MAG: hypothetical protein A2530_11185 [Sulfurimonas sp. RIFOXYD2_FULL_34_21]
MKPEIKKNLQQILYDTANELSNISEITDENKHFLVQELLKIFDTHYKLIDYIESNTIEIVEIKKIKKDKSYLKKYISAFEKNLKLYIIIKDRKNINKMVLNILLFELFMEDIEKFYKLQSDIHTFFLANPENKRNYQILQKSKKKLTDVEKKFIYMYETYEYLKSLLKFFRCHALTKKNIMTSLSIMLYKSLMKTEAISKYQIKEILETMFFKLDAPTVIRVDEMDKIYIKTVVDKLIIQAYPSSNDIESLLNFEEINKKLLKKIEKYENAPSEKIKFENFIKDKISPLQGKLSL